jgi:AAA+ ATPase superfamily predicted ATPase
MAEVIKFIKFLFVDRTRSPALIEAQKRYYKANKEKHTAYVKEWRNKKKLESMDLPIS